MKKLLCLIAVIALTAPVMAADPNVLVTCNDLGNGKDVQVSYQVLVEDGVDPGLMRGIALDITVDNGCLIDVIKDYDAEGATPPSVDSENIPAGYSIYMGSVIFAADPNLISSFGDPVAPPNHIPPYPDTLGGLGTTGITVEMGSLYAEGDPAPAAAGDLFKLELSDPGSAGSCVMTIAANTTRGGCVMENGASANVVSAGCTITFGPPPVPGWSCDGQDKGNADGDASIGFLDLGLVKKAFFTNTNVHPHGTGTGQYNCCADFDHDGVIGFLDLGTIKANFFTGGYTPCGDISCP
jgi:hypothetical protein